LKVLERRYKPNRLKVTKNTTTKAVVYTDVVSVALWYKLLIFTLKKKTTIRHRAPNFGDIYWQTGAYSGFEVRGA